jgi:hypothetical protein
VINALVALVVATLVPVILKTAPAIVKTKRKGNQHGNVELKTRQVFKKGPKTRLARKENQTLVLQSRSVQFG